MGIREKERDGGGDNGQAQRDDGGGRRGNKTGGKGAGGGLRGLSSSGVSFARFYTCGLKLGLRQYLRGVMWTSSLYVLMQYSINLVEVRANGVLI